jgi:DNA-binding PadR family transcriptional regulator
MEYSDNELIGITHVELMLLELVAEKKVASGYQLNRLVQEGRYRIWADIGTTSIYLGLEKLEKRGFLESTMDMSKTGRGPIPRKFRLTRKGKLILRDSVISALKDSRERERRFDLALAGLPVIKRSEALSALEKRKEMLLQSASSIMEKYNEQGGDRLPFHARALFKHPLAQIEQELNFTQTVIDELK